MERLRKIFFVFFLTCLLTSLSGCAAATGGGPDSLNIDYVGADGEVTEEELTESGDSGGMFGWLKEKLSSDKKSAGDDYLADVSSGEEEESGLQRMYGLEDSQDENSGEGSTVPEEEDGEESSRLPEGGQTKSPVEDAGLTAAGQGSSGNIPNQSGSQAKPELPERKDTVTFTIRCDTAVDNGMHKESQWAGIVPADGCILPVITMEFEEGETVFDLLCEIRDTYKLHMSYRGSGGGEYIDGINNLYEFDGGRWSGWMYCVNGWYPNYGCGQYTVKSGDVIEWNYTCDLGLDLDAGMEGAQEWKDTHD